MLTGCCYIFIDCNKFWCKDIDVTHCLWDVLFFMLAETPPPEEDLSSWSEEKQPEPVVEALPDDRNDTIAEVHKETSCHPEVRAALKTYRLLIQLCHILSSRHIFGKNFICFQIESSSQSSR